jgi:hypothetical protein
MRHTPALSLVFCLAGALAGCAGARYEVAASRARYPVSFSPAIPDSRGKVLYLGHELESKGSFEHSEIQLGFLYGWLASDPVDVSEKVNDEVLKQGGEGVAELAVSNRNCFTNYLFPLPLLPFYPGCQVVTVTGTVVVSKPGKVASAPVAKAGDTQ